jgi:hypothetical protein
MPRQAVDPAWEISQRRSAEACVHRDLADAEILAETTVVRGDFVEMPFDAPCVRLACAAAHRL